jgi:TM2 domain-containing membrane protein YozV
MAMIQCPECHGMVSSQALSCPTCGYPINQPAAMTTAITVKRKSRSLAIFLALILGGIGAHKFYVDKPGAGLVYLLFVWTAIPSIIGFFEAIQYLCMTEEKFQEKYLQKQL